MILRHMRQLIWANWMTIHQIASTIVRNGTWTPGLITSPSHTVIRMYSYSIGYDSEALECQKVVPISLLLETDTSHDLYRHRLQYISDRRDHVSRDRGLS